MMKKSVKDLLMNIDQPILLMDEQYQLVFSNLSAREVLPHPALLCEQADVQRVLQMLGDRAQAEDIAACTVTLQVGACPARMIRLERGYALLLRPRARPTVTDDALDNLLTLTREQLVTGVGGFVQTCQSALQDLEAHSDTKEETLNALIDTGSQLAQRLDSLLMLVAQYGREPIRVTDRVDLREALDDAMGLLDAQFRQYRLTPRISGFEQPIGSLYASRTWVVRALRECLLEVMTQTRKTQGRLHIHVVQHGGFVILSMAADVNATLEEGESVERLVPHAGVSDKSLVNGGLGLALMGKVIEALGGRHRIMDWGSGPAILLELPTGGPATEIGLEPGQVEAYALALSTLLRSRAAGVASVH
jgi:hypothetical protein